MLGNADIGLLLDRGPSPPQRRRVPNHSRTEQCARAKEKPARSLEGKRAGYRQAVLMRTGSPLPNHHQELCSVPAAGHDRW